MRGIFFILVSFALMMICVAAGDSSSEGFDQQVTEELRAINPAAAELFAEGNASREAGNLEMAILHYEEVLKQVPTFDHAARRLGMCLAEAGQRERGIRMCRQALNMNPSLVNRAGLIHALTSQVNTSRISVADLQEASREARYILDDPTAEVNELMACMLASVRNQDLGLLQATYRQLTTRYPRDWQTPYVGWIIAMSEGEFGRAGELLTQAKGLGMPLEVAADLELQTEQAIPAWKRYGKKAGWAIGGWAVVMALLMVVGLILSAVTMKTSHRIALTRREQEVSSARLVKTIYRGVLWLSCLLYYLSMPLVLLVVLALGGGLIYLFFAMGHIPIKLVLAIVLVVAFTVWAMVKSLFVRGRDEDPGKRLDLSTEPRLEALLVEVADMIGTRPVDNVYLTPGADIAVMERGGLRNQLHGGKERCLILGAAVLDGMPISAFKSILAHEYGHFVNKDTAGGGFALAIRRSLHTMALSLAENGANGWYNPAWLFLNLFHRIFLRISHGASRLQEVLADRWAAQAYGASAFETGLLHVITASVRFDHHANNSLKEIVEHKKALVNLYAYSPADPLDSEAIGRSVQEVIEAPGSAYDSHPPFQQRIAWVRQMAEDTSELAFEEEPDVWSVFDHRDQLEEEMTDLIRRNVELGFGIRLPKAVEETTEA